MIGGTIVVYNGVTMVNCQTTGFDEESILDEAGVDEIGRKYTVSVIGYVHGDANVKTVNTFPNKDRSSAALHHRSVRGALMEPRKNFQMVTGADTVNVQGGVTLLQAGPPGKTIAHLDRDVNNGPKPLRCEINKIASDEVFEIEYTIEIMLPPECVAANTLVLSNTWTCTDEIDKNKYTNRTYRGKIRLRDATDNPHDYRGWCLPPLLEGFRRDSMEFESSADGLILEYTINDTEAAYAPPAPATDWSYTHVEAADKFAINIYSSMDITMSGPRDANKQLMISNAASIVRGHLLRGNVPNVGNDPDKPDTTHLVESFSVQDTSGSSQVNEIKVSAKFRRINLNRQRLEQISDIIGQPIDGTVLAGYDNNRNPGTRAGEQVTATGIIPAVGALSRAITAADCRGDKQLCRIGRGALFSAATEVYPCGTDPSNVKLTPRFKKGSIPEADRDFGEDHNKDGMYEHYDGVTQTDLPELNIALPIAGVTDGTNNPGTVVIRLAPQQSFRNVEVKGTRKGKPPKFPEPKQEVVRPDGSVEKLIKTTIYNAVPSILADGALQYSMKIVYTYAVIGFQKILYSPTGSLFSRENAKKTISTPLTEVHNPNGDSGATP